jgi:hypothetical protein
MKRIILLLLLLTGSRGLLQAQYCDGTDETHTYSATFAEDVGDCGFSLTAAAYYGVNQTIAFPTQCITQDDLYYFALYINMGSGFVLAEPAVCTNTSSYTFQNLSIIDPYKIDILYLRYVACAGAFEPYVDEATYTVTNNVCGQIGSGPTTIQRLSELDVNCTIPNNTSTTLMSQDDIVFQPGTVMTGLTSSGVMHAYINTCTMFREIDPSAQNSSKTYPHLMIYPNPNKGTFTLSLPDDEIRDISIYDMLGQIIYSKQQLNGDVVIDISNEPKGIYFLKAVNNTTGDVRVNKIVVQ